jgi:hypothetical protein
MNCPWLSEFKARASGVPIDYSLARFSGIAEKERLSF